MSASFYPPKIPSQQSELNAPDWANAPANTSMLAYGNLSLEGSNLLAAGFLSDVHNPSAPIALQKIYRGASSDADARRLAHQFADDIIGRLSGGLPGVSQTQIAFVSNKSGTKEVWAMDYDGANQHQLTHLKSIALTPRWSPDATRIAFTCFVPYRGITSPQICLFSTASDRMISFPRFRGTNSSPAWSPDGAQIAFMSSQNGDPEIYVCDSDGSHLQRLTFAAGVSTSPVWNPKTANRSCSSAIAQAIRFSTLPTPTARTCNVSTCRTWVTSSILPGHRMDNCSHLVGDGRAAISISM